MIYYINYQELDIIKEDINISNQLFEFQIQIKYEKTKMLKLCLLKNTNIVVKYYLNFIYYYNCIFDFIILRIKYR